MFILHCINSKCSLIDSFQYDLFGMELLFGPSRSVGH